MPPTRNFFQSVKNTPAPKIWKESPPGPEQKELERLFTNGLISEADSSNAVRLKYPIFAPFSAKVFTSHFRKTKAKLGLMLTNGTDNQNNPEISGDEIAELGDYKQKKSLATKDSGDDKVKEDHGSYVFPPIQTWWWEDHSRKCKFVSVSIPIFPECTDISFDLSDGGDMVTVNYIWPKPTFIATELFEDELRNNEISVNHPKIHALQSKLLAEGITANSHPKGHVEVPLPIKVQTEEDTWIKLAIQKAKGQRIVYLEFKGFTDKVHIKNVDRSIKFD